MPETSFMLMEFMVPVVPLIFVYGHTLQVIGFYLLLVRAALFGQVYREIVALTEAQTTNQAVEAA